MRIRFEKELIRNVLWRDRKVAPRVRSAHSGQALTGARARTQNRGSWRIPLRRPMAATYLGRIAHMTGEASLARAFAEGRLELKAIDDVEKRIEARLRELARDDRAIHDEAAALATARGWPLGRGFLPYGWRRLHGARLVEVAAELVRILAREIFELEGFARELHGGGDDVISLAVEAAIGRHAVREALLLTVPDASLPGAK
jgi:hypothetical protein